MSRINNQKISILFAVIGVFGLSSWWVLSNVNRPIPALCLTGNSYYKKASSVNKSYFYLIDGEYPFSIYYKEGRVYHRDFWRSYSEEIVSTAIQNGLMHKNNEFYKTFDVKGGLYGAEACVQFFKLYALSGISE